MRVGSAPAQTKLRRSRLGRILVLYRATRSIGVRDLAKETGISTATLSRIERGHAMDATTLIALWNWLLDAEPEDRSVIR